MKALSVPYRGSSVGCGDTSVRFWTTGLFDVVPAIKVRGASVITGAVRRGRAVFKSFGQVDSRSGGIPVDGGGHVEKDCRGSWLSFAGLIL